MRSSYTDCNLQRRSRDKLDERRNDRPTGYRRPFLRRLCLLGDKESCPTHPAAPPLHLSNRFRLAHRDLRLDGWAIYRPILRP